MGIRARRKLATSSGGSNAQPCTWSWVKVWSGIDELTAAVPISQRREIGVSFHVRPEDYGTYHFSRLAEAVIAYAAELGRRCGGGKRSFEFDAQICNAS
jgi:hypothetical protein